MSTRTSLPAAVLWDMDGTLIDSEPYWIAAEQELASRFGVEWTHEDGLAMVGNPLPVSGETLRERGVDLPVEDIIDFLLARVSALVRSAVPWQDDARDLLGQVVAAGVPCALVTMSYGRLADAFLAHAPDAFAVVVTGDQVERGKPDPESYLTAASRLGVDIHECVAIEDSPSGVGAAYASGAATLGVRRLTPIEAREGLSRTRDLSQWTPARLGALVGGAAVDELGQDT